MLWNCHMRRIYTLQSWCTAKTATIPGHKWRRCMKGLLGDEASEVTPFNPAFLVKTWWPGGRAEQLWIVLCVHGRQSWLAKQRNALFRFRQVKHSWNIYLYLLSFLCFSSKSRHNIRMLLKSLCTARFLLAQLRYLKHAKGNLYRNNS